MAMETAVCLRSHTTQCSVRPAPNAGWAGPAWMPMLQGKPILQGAPAATAPRLLLGSSKQCGIGS